MNGPRCPGEARIRAGVRAGRRLGRLADAWRFSLGAGQQHGDAVFARPEEGLGFDQSPVAHMWRTMIWPNNFL